MIEVPVLIVGGGPVGLTASLYLSHLGIDSLLVERHSGTAKLPKSRSVNVRSMEMYRQLGLEQALVDIAMPARFGGCVVWAESLTGREINRVHSARGAAAKKFSPTRDCMCAQDIMEPLLHERAEAAGPGRLRFGTRMVELDCAKGGVTAVIEDDAGKRESVRARYLIASDGAQSTIRSQLGITRKGEPNVYDSVNIHVRANLTPWIDHRPATLYLIEQPDLRGTFNTINGSDRWAFLITSMTAYGFTPEQFTHEFSASIIRKAVGAPDLDVKILGVGAWQANALVAEQFRCGPVFLAGDAAHEMPPTGGFGLNTGVQDIQNLAWKLAAVLRGEAEDALLDSYDLERRPVGERITHNSMLNARSMGRSSRQTEAVLPRKEFLNEIGLLFGARYESAAVIPDGRPVPTPVDPVTEYLPSASPGSRAPHVWLTREGRQVSTVDLFGHGFVLFAGPRGQGWAKAAAGLPAPKIQVVAIGADYQDPDAAWQQAYDVDEDGAVLVRPDGHVAWRSRAGAADPADVLRKTVDALLCRESNPSMRSAA